LPVRSYRTGNAFSGTPTASFKFHFFAPLLDVPVTIGASGILLYRVIAAPVEPPPPRARPKD
jgi:hypothetical protein